MTLLGVWWGKDCEKRTQFRHPHKHIPYEYKGMMAFVLHTHEAHGEIIVQRNLSLRNMFGIHTAYILTQKRTKEFIPAPSDVVIYFQHLISIAYKKRITASYWQ